jgi:hypothetical protein
MAEVHTLRHEPFAPPSTCYGVGQVSAVFRLTTTQPADEAAKKESRNKALQEWDATWLSSWPSGDTSYNPSHGNHGVNGKLQDTGDATQRGEGEDHRQDGRGQS